MAFCDCISSSISVRWSLICYSYLDTKIADEMLPSTTTLKVLNLLSKVTPKAKLFPYKDLNEFIFREPGKRKLVGNFVYPYLSNVYKVKRMTRALLYHVFLNKMYYIYQLFKGKKSSFILHYIHIICIIKHSHHCGLKCMHEPQDYLLDNIFCGWICCKVWPNKRLALQNLHSIF